MQHVVSGAPSATNTHAAIVPVRPMPAAQCMQRRIARAQPCDQLVDERERQLDRGRVQVGHRPPHGTVPTALAQPRDVCRVAIDQLALLDEAHDDCALHAVSAIARS